MDVAPRTPTPHPLSERGMIGPMPDPLRLHCDAEPLPLHGDAEPRPFQGDAEPRRLHDGGEPPRFLGNPTNPTSVLHPAATVAALARPGRLLVVDEAFADTVPGEPASLAGRRDLPGLVVVRSFTKTWGLAGLRIGYLLAEAALVARL